MLSVLFVMVFACCFSELSGRIGNILALLYAYALGISEAFKRHLAGFLPFINPFDRRVFY